jgi:hypothetical protein
MSSQNLNCSKYIDAKLLKITLSNDILPVKNSFMGFLSTKTIYYYHVSVDIVNFHR